MNGDFVTFEQADKLCDLEFDYKCIACYDEEDFEITYEYSDYNSGYYRDNLISAPTLAQVQNWFLEQKKVYIEIYAGDYLNHFGYELKFDWADNHRYCCQGYRTPREALSAGIDAALKYIEDRDER